MSKIQVVGDNCGLIEGFNVFVQQLPARFWNSFADRRVSKMESEVIDATECLLVNAAHECDHHTGYGIITSDEWNAVVKPMVNNVPEDILHGAFAVVGGPGRKLSNWYRASKWLFVPMTSGARWQPG